jgi:hypothetical protein
MDEPNTHGYEMEENEHDVEERVYSDITPFPQLSEIVRSLKNQAGLEFKSRCTDHWAWKAADHIIELEHTAELEKEIKDHMWKGLAQVEKQRDEMDKENKFLKGLINKYHLENDAFSRKENTDGN